VNSAVRLSFNENFGEKSTCESYEQYTEPTQKHQMPAIGNADAIQTSPKLNNYHG